jgi:hypothetical protein
MAGLVPAIHVLLAITKGKTWMPATSAGMTKKAMTIPPSLFRPSAQHGAGTQTPQRSKEVQRSVIV